MKNPLRWLNTHTGFLCFGGLGAVALWNWWKWRGDRELAERLREQKPEPVELEATPKVSVLVAAWNEASMIQTHIQSFQALRYPDKELVLCAAGDDGTYQIARSQASAQVVVLEQYPGEGKQRALRRCFGHATGEIIYLTDADCILDNSSFDRTLAAILNGADAASGTYRPLTGQLDTPFVLFRWAAQLYGEAHRGSLVGGMEGRNCGVTRAALETVGAFREDVRTGTDYFLAQKLLAAGYSIEFVRDSAVHTEFVQDLRVYVRKQSRWIRNLLVHGPRFGAWGDVGASLRTSFTGLGMLAAPLWFVGRSRLIPVVWLSMLVQAAMARTRYTAFAERSTGRRFGLRVFSRIVPYLFVDFVAWAMALADFLAPSRRGRW